MSFRYDVTEKPALIDVSCRFAAGTLSAVVGPSGGGKSTLIKLLLGLYAPSSGSVKVDGTPLTNYELSSFRRRTALVSQDLFLFDASVHDNIAFGRADASREDVIEAARSAGIHEVILNLPNGYDTRVGLDGLRLSGGQKQRITLARAILTKPELLVLDEPTNALDSFAEELVQKALYELQGRCTIVVVAHRLGTIERADQVLVLEAGRLCESGRPQELLARGGLYARMHALQFRLRADETAAGGGQVART